MTKILISDGLNVSLIPSVVKARDHYCRSLFLPHGKLVGINQSNLIFAGRLIYFSVHAIVPKFRAA